MVRYKGLISPWVMSRQQFPESLVRVRITYTSIIGSYVRKTSVETSSSTLRNNEIVRREALRRRSNMTASPARHDSMLERGIGVGDRLAYNDYIEEIRKVEYPMLNGTIPRSTDIFISHLRQA